MLTEQQKEIIITAHVYAQQARHQNLTTALVLTFVLEKYEDKLNNCLANFFNFKHRILKEAIMQTKSVSAQDNFEDSLIMSIYKSRSMNDFIKELVISKGGIIIKKFDI